MKHIVIAYHDKCNDGYCSAAVAVKHLTKVGTRLHLLPAVYGHSLGNTIFDLREDLTKSGEDLSKVFILDFCTNELETLALSDLGIPIVIIDHHKSAKPIMDKEYENINTYYSEDVSGAMLTWEYFNALNPAPEVVANVSDRDLFKFELLGTRAFHAGVLANYSRDDIGFWHSLLEETTEAERKYHAICLVGWDILEYQETLFKTMLEFNGKIVKPVIKSATVDSIGGINIKVINHIGMYHGFCDPTLASDFSAYIKQELGVHLVLLYRIDPDSDGYIYSVRSSGSAIHVTARDIAEYFGGGGHDQASGFNSATLITD